MASLADERIRRLHKWFLDAAERFPDLHFVAVTPDEALQGGWFLEQDRWPSFPIDGQMSQLGLTGQWWLRALNKPAGTPFTPIKSVWLQINGRGRLWEGGFLNGKRLTNESHDQLQAQFSHLVEGIAEFDRLADVAAGHFLTPTPIYVEDCPLEEKPAHRWLEVVAGMPFVVAGYEWGVFVRRVPGDLFTASARAIETIGNATAPPPAPAEATDAAGSTPLAEIAYHSRGSGGAASLTPAVSPKQSEEKGAKRSRKGEGGRPRLTQEQEQERLGVLRDWWQAQSAGIDQKTFCRDKRVTRKQLRTYVNWHGTRQSRNTNSE